MTNAQVQPQQQTDAREMFSFKLQPQYWPAKYGEKPLLGVLKAPDEFTAIRMGYNRGMWIPNFTFQVEAVQITSEDAQKLISAQYASKKKAG